MGSMASDALGGGPTAGARVGEEPSADDIVGEEARRKDGDSVGRAVDDGGTCAGPRERGLGSADIEGCDNPEVYFRTLWARDDV